jgi:hypothetical protein
VFAISGFRSDADEICALLGYYAKTSGNPIDHTFPYINSVTLADFLIFLDFLIPEDGTDILSRNVGKGLSFDAV